MTRWIGALVVLITVGFVALATGAPQATPGGAARVPITSSPWRLSLDGPRERVIAYLQYPGDAGGVVSPSKEIDLIPLLNRKILLMTDRIKTLSNEVERLKDENASLKKRLESCPGTGAR
jgi:hypothetical protein